MRGQPIDYPIIGIRFVEHEPAPIFTGSELRFACFISAAGGMLFAFAMAFLWGLV